MPVDPARLKKARMKRGWTQADLAMATKLSRSFICQLESGARDASPGTVKHIEDTLGENVSGYTICSSCGEVVQ